MIGTCTISRALALLALAAVPAAAQTTAAQTAAIGRSASRAERIANAVAAAPAEIARNATVKDWPAREGAPFTVLREGTNGWTCLPDEPASRGNDPMCLDEVWREAVEAAALGRPVRPRGVGYAYMLDSDAEASNTDPTSRGPTADNHWHHVGPHVMVIYPDTTLLRGLPTTPRADGPYVMFPGTPIAHVMLSTASGTARPPAARP